MHKNARKRGENGVTNFKSRSVVGCGPKTGARAWAILELAARVCDVWCHCFSAVNIGDASIGCFICVGIRNTNLYGSDTI